MEQISNEKPTTHEPTVVVVDEQMGCILTEVRTGTCVRTIALSNQSAVDQLKGALFSAWALGFQDGQTHPSFDCHGTPHQPVAEPFNQDSSQFRMRG